MGPYDQAFGDCEEEELPFNKRKAPESDLQRGNPIIKHI